MDIPDKNAVETTVKKIFDSMFPMDEGLLASGIKEQDVIGNMLGFVIEKLTQKKEYVVIHSLKRLSAVKKTLIKDAKFILESDPAATSLVEVIAIYPGFYAIFCYRLAHLFASYSLPLLPRMITEYAHKNTGIDIHPGAVIGCPFSIDHGTGIVIGETTNIGNNVKVYQGVTLGALSVEKNKAQKKRHPTIEDNVILYSGCTILGGETVVGRNSIIGGNVWLTESIAPFSVVYHKSEIIVRDQTKFNEPINFII